MDVATRTRLNICLLATIKLFFVFQTRSVYIWIKNCCASKLGWETAWIGCTDATQRQTYQQIRAR